MLFVDCASLLLLAFYSRFRSVVYFATSPLRPPSCVFICIYHHMYMLLFRHSLTYVPTSSHRSPVPPTRWQDTAFHHPHADMPGMVNHQGGHFVQRDLAAFDAAFFEIGAQEAAAMDPQQRLLLETSYEALENAGLGLDKVRGANCGVWVAAFAHDYEVGIY